MSYIILGINYRYSNSIEFSFREQRRNFLKKIKKVNIFIRSLSYLIDRLS